MSDPVTRALVVGQAAAAVLVERAAEAWQGLNHDVSTTLAELQTEWDKFNTEVQRRADAMSVPSVPTGADIDQADLQASLDELRAEVAQLRSELQRYRSQSA